MPTFTRAHSLTSCDTCHELTGDTWRDLAAHVAAHQKAAMDAARQARIDALGRGTCCDTGRFGMNGWAENGMIGDISETASDLTPTPPLSTPDRRNRKEDA